MSCRIAAFTVVLVLAGATRAMASPVVEALDARTDGEGPALSQGTVVWSRPAGAGGVQVLARPAAGGTVGEAGRAALSATDGEVGGWTLVAGQGRVGLRVVPASARRSVLFGLTRLRSAPLGAVMAVERDFWTWSGGFVTLERAADSPRAMVTNDRGETRPLALPAGAAPQTLAVRDATAAVVVVDADGASREVAVIDITTGSVVRRVDLGDARGLGVTSLSLDAQGELALTGEGGDGADALIWAPAGATRFELVTLEDRFGLVQVANGRIAFVAPGGRREAVRPVVLEPHAGGAPTVVFRGPPAYQVESLDFDGAHVAWASQHCEFVADAVPAASRLTIPAGPCARTEIAVTVYATPQIARTHPRLPVRIRCLTAADERCRVDVRAYEARTGKRLGRTRTTIPRGTRRVVRLALRRAAAGRIRRGDLALFVIRTIDPDGRITKVGPI